MENILEEQLSIEQLTQVVNKHNWKEYQQNLSAIPQNCYYRTIPSMQIQYQRLRTAMMNNDLSQKTYDLTTLLLTQKTNNYYALMLRKDYVFKQLQINKSKQISTQLIKKELNFTNNLLKANAKQYHLWNYKKDLLQQQNIIAQNFQGQHKQVLNIFKRQLTFLTSLLIQDERNYHVWDYRFWLVVFCNQVQEQLKWTFQILFKKQFPSVSSIQQAVNNIDGYQAKQIKVNWKNVYSLWSYRQSLIRYLKNNQFSIIQQINNILSFLKVVSNFQNQCAWNYLLGLINFYQLKIQNYQNVLAQINQIPNNRFKLQIILNILNKKIQKSQIQGRAELYLERLNILQILLQKDQVRESYYKYFIQKFEK